MNSDKQKKIKKEKLLLYLLSFAASTYRMFLLENEFF